MVDEKKHISEILKAAIKGEEEGYRYYDLLAERTTNEDARRKLENLRDDEIRHKETLIGIYHKFVGKDIGRLPDKGLGTLNQVFKNGRLDDLKTEIEFITLAIEVELATSKFYDEEKNLVNNPEFQAIFDQLAEEEYNHYQLLQAEKDALGGNYHWFSYDSSSPLED
ncbi:MAG: ferritin family protein [Candidatus Zixiibacteriota bacterium]